MRKGASPSAAQVGINVAAIQKKMKMIKREKTDETSGTRVKASKDFIGIINRKD